MQTNEITFRSPRVREPLDFLVLSDTHGKRIRQALKLARERFPDAVLCAGDVMNRHRRKSTGREAEPLAEMASVCPTFFVAGNHDAYGDDGPAETLRQAGVRVLENGEEAFRGIRIGGVPSVQFAPEREGEIVGFVRRFCREDGAFRLLLCHHPEYYDRYFGGMPFDLMISGHAHGGQIRLFGRGLFAPGQGVLPKYTSGLYHERLLVSRGMANHVLVPRLFNPTEMIWLRLVPETQA